MVFQDPMTALDPTMTVCRQIAEAVKVHEPRLSKVELDKRVTELMELVGMKDAGAKAELFPYQFFRRNATESGACDRTGGESIRSDR